MVYLLAPKFRPVLSRLAESNTLCAFDFDGTLAPIVTRPENAHIPCRTRSLLRELAKLYPCIIVSGRAREDLVDRVTGIGLKDAIGNHGAEPAINPLPFRSRITEWKEALEHSLREAPGVWVEDKGISLAVHYRQSPKKATVPRIVHKVSETFDGVRVMGGKQVVNLVITEAPHKGEAILAAQKELHCRSILYVGDDENDEDAFALRGNVVSVRVCQNHTSQARYFIRRRAEMDTLLRILISERKRATGRDRI